MTLVLLCSFGLIVKLIVKSGLEDGSEAGGAEDYIGCKTMTIGDSAPGLMLCESELDIQNPVSAPHVELVEKVVSSEPLKEADYLVPTTNNLTETPAS